MKESVKASGVVFTVLRTIIFLPCAFLMYTFLYTMNLGQVNFGNITGCIYCGSVMLLILLYPLLKKVKQLKIIAWICAGLMTAFAVYCAAISCLIVSEMVSGDDRAVEVSAMNGGTPQTVIVLGCMVLDGEPSPMLALRLEKAKEYLDAHPKAVCIVAGGQGSNEVMSEAECMYRYLTSNGIDGSRIYREDASSDTTQNIRFSKEIIDAEGLPKDVVVVSECYHIYRGVRLAKLEGLNAAGIYPDPAPVIKTMPSYWLREILALSRDLFLT
ncbi:MAG: YdcF family protein [Ruminiclostridium sp.]|nr:YdcF family protein [Ruminiclostridium sp.]